MVGRKIFLQTVFTALMLLSCACAKAPEKKDTLPKPTPEKEVYKKMRKAMLEQLRHYYKIMDPRVLEAMGKVRRHLYIPEAYRKDDTAYGDYPWPIGYDQTISQPYIVAYMTEKMALKPGEKALEIGTGSGYQAAILAEMGAEVFSIEIIPQLADHARTVLKSEGYNDVKVLTGDGYKGWPEHAPFDVILAACAPENIPRALLEQLKENGRMIIPVGEYSQRLIIVRKKEGKFIQENDLPVRFVPMVHGKESR